MELKPFLLKSFNLKPEEGTKFLLLFLHSFFLGLFIAFYFVPANSVFIRHIGSDRLPLAYIFAGLAGYLMTSFYSALQKRVHSRTLFLSALSFLLIIPLIARIGLNYSDNNEIVNIPILSNLGFNFTKEGWLSFFVFIWGWPFISLVAIESGGIALRFFNLRQVKRLFGLVNMGGVVASVIGYLAIPLLLKFLNHPYHLLTIGLVGVVISIVILLFVYKFFGHETPELKNDDDSNSEKTRIFQLLKQPYLSLIFVAATLSMTVIYFTDFSFLASIKVQTELISTPEQLSNFLALVYGGLKIGELVMSYFSGRILSRYGVKLGLVILPLSLTLLILGAMLSGYISGVESILFFSFMILNKSFERIIRRALDDPSFNILYQLLPDNQKLLIQTKVGVIMQLSIGIAGILLFVLSKVLKNDDGSFNLLYFVTIFLPLLLTWTIVALRLYSQYKNKLKMILEDKNRKKEKQIHKDIYGRDVLENQLKASDKEWLLLSTSIISEMNPRILEPYSSNLIYSKEPTIQKAILRNIDASWNENLVKDLVEIEKNTKDEEILHLIKNSKNVLDYTDIKDKMFNPIKANEALHSNDSQEKLKLLKYLYLYNGEGKDEILLTLMNDEDKTVKQTAINISIKFQTEPVINGLCELLQNTEYRHISASILGETGDKCLKPLSEMFKSGTSVSVLTKICEILGRIGSRAAQSILLQHLNFPHREIQEAVIRALYYSHFQTDAAQTVVVKKKIEEVVGNILWVFVSINDVETQINTLKLIQALDLERDNNFEKLFNLLSFIYQPATIDLIKTNIIGENIIFALEIIDNFITQDVKQLIIPLIDKLSVNQRMKKLDVLFPMKKMKFPDRLKEIIITDFYRIDQWTKNRAIELLGKLYKHKRSRDINKTEEEVFSDLDIWTKEQASEVLNQIRKTEIPDEIFLCLHHPDELVYSTAAKIIYDENPTACFNHLRKLSAKKQDLIRILNNDSGDLLLERLKLLKRIPLFFRLPENTLVKVAKVFKTKELIKGSKINFVNEDNTENIIIVLKGTLEYTKDDVSKTLKFSNRDIIVRGMNIDIDAEFIDIKRSSTILVGNRFEYFNLLVDETEIIQYMFEIQNMKK